jgi:hypothetical protein
MFLVEKLQQQLLFEQAETLKLRTWLDIAAANNSARTE